MPSQWKYLPQTLDMCAMGPFTAAVDAQADIVVTAADSRMLSTSCQSFSQLIPMLASYEHVTCLMSRPRGTIPLPAHQNREKS